MKKVILITGASSGIGYALARELGKDECIVYATSLNIDSMEDLKKLNIFVRKLDVTLDNDIKKCVDEIIEIHKKIDVVYCNAGFATYGSVENTSIDKAMKMFNVNFFGIKRIIDYILPHMREANHGRIVFTESLASDFTMPFVGFYSATKSALSSIATALRGELSDTSIKVIEVKPGPIKTGFDYNGLEKDALVNHPLVYSRLYLGFLIYYSNLYKLAPSSKRCVKIMRNLTHKRFVKSIYKVTFKCKIIILSKRLFGDFILNKILIYKYIKYYKKNKGF